MNITDWKIWFESVLETIMTKLAPNHFAIFYQSDIRFPIHNQLNPTEKICEEWLDKGYLIIKVAEKVGLRVIWHKIMLTHPIGTSKTGRAGYSHMICVAPVTLTVPDFSQPDVVMRGETLWASGAGLDAMILAVRFAKKLKTECLIDPFCGYGTTLAVADYFGIKSIGIELSLKKCKKAEVSTIIQENGKLTFLRRTPKTTERASF